MWTFLPYEKSDGAISHNRADENKQCQSLLRKVTCAAAASLQKIKLYRPRGNPPSVICPQQAAELPNNVVVIEKAEKPTLGGKRLLHCPCREANGLPYQCSIFYTCGHSRKDRSRCDLLGERPSYPRPAPGASAAPAAARPATGMPALTGAAGCQ